MSDFTNNMKEKFGLAIISPYVNSVWHVYETSYCKMNKPQLLDIIDYTYEHNGFVYEFNEIQGDDMDGCLCFVFTRKD